MSTNSKHPIGILDFYESLSIVPWLVVSINVAFEELSKHLKCDNGFLLACAEKTFLEYINACYDKID